MSIATFLFVFWSKTPKIPELRKTIVGPIMPASPFRSFTAIDNKPGEFTKVTFLGPHYISPDIVTEDLTPVHYR